MKNSSSQEVGAKDFPSPSTMVSPEAKIMDAEKLEQEAKKTEIVADEVVSVKNIHLVAEELVRNFTFFRKNHLYFSKK